MKRFNTDVKSNQKKSISISPELTYRNYDDSRHGSSNSTKKNISRRKKYLIEQLDNNELVNNILTIKFN